MILTPLCKLGVIPTTLGDLIARRGPGVGLCCTESVMSCSRSVNNLAVCLRLPVTRRLCEICSAALSTYVLVHPSIINAYPALFS